MSVTTSLLRAAQTLQLAVPGYWRHMLSLMENGGVHTRSLVVIPGHLEAEFNCWRGPVREAWMDDTGGAGGHRIAIIQDLDMPPTSKLLLIGQRVIGLEFYRENRFSTEARARAKVRARYQAEMTARAVEEDVEAA